MATKPKILGVQRQSGDGAQHPFHKTLLSHGRRGRQRLGPVGGRGSWEAHLEVVPSGLVHLREEKDGEATRPGCVSQRRSGEEVWGLPGGSLGRESQGAAGTLTSGPEDRCWRR